MAAFSDCKRHLDRQQRSAFASLITCANRDKFREAGKPLTATFPIRVYRGTDVSEATGSECEWSWTLALDIACKFALGHAQEPAVLSAQIDQDEVFWFNPDRGEQEVVCRPRVFQRYAISLSEMEMRSQRAIDEITRRNRARLNLRMGQIASAAIADG